MTATPRPHPTADTYRMRWRRLMDDATTYHLDRDQAIDLVTIAIELGKLGWTLTPDETDWLPPKEIDNG